MDETTRTENTPNEPMDGSSVKPELSASTTPKSTWLLRIQSLDAIVNSAFSIFKRFFFVLLLLAIIYIFINIPTQQGGIVIQPFDISKNEDLTGIAIADQLTAELMRIQKIHNITQEEISLKTNFLSASSVSYFVSELSAEQSLGKRELFTPKAESVDTGTISVGSNSLDPGKLMMAFKNILHGNKPVTKMRGSLQRYGSTIVLVAVLEGSNVQSWMIRQSIDDNNEEQFHEMIRNLSFIIAHDLPQSNVSAKTWEGLMYYTEALDSYNHYELSGDLDDLSRAGNYSLKAISSEKGYENPFKLLDVLESIYAMRERNSDAIAYANKAIKLDPTSAHGWFSKGITLYNQGKYDGAIQAFNESIRLDPNFVAAWCSKGNALYLQGRYNEAIDAYNEAIRLDPNFALPWNSKGLALIKQGKYDDANQALNESIRLDPNFALPWNNKGIALIKQGKYDDAIQAFNESIRLNPNFEAAWNNKGRVLYDQGKYDKAIQAYDEAIRLEPKYAQAWINKGVALSDQGKYDGAIKAHDEAIRLDPNNAMAWNSKGIALYNQGKNNEAINAYDEVIRLDPNESAAWINKGIALEALRRTAEANTAFAKAEELWYTG